MKNEKATSITNFWRKIYTSTTFWLCQHKKSTTTHHFFSCFFFFSILTKIKKNFPNNNSIPIPIRAKRKAIKETSLITSFVFTSQCYQVHYHNQRRKAVLIDMSHNFLLMKSDFSISSFLFMKS